MIHTVPNYFATGAPGVISVAVPAATRSRLQSSDRDLRQHVLIVLDDRVGLKRQKKREKISAIAEALLGEAGIDFDVLKRMDFESFLRNHQTDIDDTSLAESAADVLRALNGDRYVGILVPMDRAHEAIELLSEHKMSGAQNLDAFSCRGQTEWGGVISMAASDAFLPQSLAAEAQKDIEMLIRLRGEYRPRAL